MKRLAGQYLIYCILPILLVVHWVVFPQLKQQRDSHNTQKAIRSSSLPPSFNYVISGEFQGLISSFFYLNIASLLGESREEKITSQEWDELEKMFANAISLDPYFEPTFRAIQGYLPWVAERPDKAIELLKKVHLKRTWDWIVPYFIGFDYYFFLNDPKSASKYFMAAANYENAPPLLATFGARLAAESGGEEMGIQFLTRLLETKESEYERKTINSRIEALQGQAQLKALVLRFKKEQGSFPTNLHDLVFFGYIKKMPNNPYHNEYFYKEGQIRFDPFPSKK